MVTICKCNCKKKKTPSVNETPIKESYVCCGTRLQYKVQSKLIKKCRQFQKSGNNKRNTTNFLAKNAQIE